MILGIESSCDDSALALFSLKQGIVGEWTHSQLQTHIEYGGVVPDLATREHLLKLPLLLKTEESFRNQLDQHDKEITKIAVTCGPGLPGSLAMGIALAKSLALAWNIPVVGINHLKAHAFSPFIALHRQDPHSFSKSFQEILPHLGFVISGGNTLVFEIDANRNITLLAQTVDDAAGEAFDKGAKLLGMPYPGGTLIEKHALNGNPKTYDFPRAFADPKERKFSFSGLKTSLRYLLETIPPDQFPHKLSDLCASYQAAIVDQLARKFKQIFKDKPYASIGLSGGVANNKTLRAVFEQFAIEADVPLFQALPQHTTDNAAMIAFAAFIDPHGTCQPTTLAELTFQASLSLIH